MTARCAYVAGSSAVLAIVVAAGLLALAIPAVLVGLPGVVRVLLVAAGVVVLVGFVLAAVMVVAAPPRRRKL